jgi:hypothetical protein
MKEGTTLGARAESAIQRAAVLYKPRLATFNFLTFTLPIFMTVCSTTGMAHLKVIPEQVNSWNRMFSKIPSSHFRMVTRSEFHTEQPQTLTVTVLNSVARAA